MSQMSALSILILRIKTVMEKTGLSRATIYNKLNPNSAQHDPSFPRPIRLSTHAVGWVASELDWWLAQKIETRDTANGEVSL